MKKFTYYDCTKECAVTEIISLDGLEEGDTKQSRNGKEVVAYESTNSHHNRFITSSNAINNVI